MSSKLHIHGLHRQRNYKPTFQAFLWKVWKVKIKYPLIIESEKNIDTYFWYYR